MIVNHVKQGAIETRVDLEIRPPVAEFTATWMIGVVGRNNATIKWTADELNTVLTTFEVEFYGCREKEERSVTIGKDGSPGGALVTMSGLQAVAVHDTLTRLYQALRAEEVRDHVDIIDNEMGGGPAATVLPINYDYTVFVQDVTGKIVAKHVTAHNHDRAKADAVAGSWRNVAIGVAKGHIEMIGEFGNG
jgi:hypothetical protein